MEEAAWLNEIIDLVIELEEGRSVEDVYVYEKETSNNCTEALTNVEYPIKSEVQAELFVRDEKLREANTNIHQTDSVVSDVSSTNHKRNRSALDDVSQGDECPIPSKKN